MVHINLVPQSAMSGMGTFVVYLALPALLFDALSGRPVAEVYNSNYLLAFAVGSLAVLFLSVFIALKVRRVTLQRAAFTGLGSSLSNNGFIGYALVTQLFGTLGVAAAALSMLVDLILLIPVTLVLAEWASDGRAKLQTALCTALKKTVRNPLVLAIVLGFTASALQWQPPQSVQRTLAMLGASAAPLSLFVIGGMLVGISVSGQKADIGQMVGLKLILHPLLVALMVWWLPPFEPVLQLSAVLLAAVPMAGVFPLIAQAYGQQQICAAALVCATLLSFLSLNGVLLLMDQLGLLTVLSG